MIAKRLLGSALALTLLTAACANDDGTDTAQIAPGQEVAADAAPTSQAQGTNPVGTGPAAFLGSTGLGNILIGADGRTLYGFTNDNEAKSTCYGGCEEAWPPVIVDQNWTVGPGLDLGIFATTARDDGRLQLVAGKWPLYYYVEDQNPGDVKGQGSGGVWFVANVDGTLLLDGAAPAVDDQAQPQQSAGDENGGDEQQPAPPAQGVAVATATTELGETLIDAGGLTLYGFTQDSNGVPSCDGTCAGAWPPLIVDALPADLDPSVFSVATRPDGTLQLVAGVWPLYRFAGDAAPGDVNGQGSGDVWFAVSPDGGLIGRNGAPTVEVEAGGISVDTDSGSSSGSSDY